MRRTSYVSIVAGLTVALCAGCALNPVSGRPEFVLVSTNREKQIGQDEAKKVEEGIGLVDSPALAAYVESVGQRLAARSPRQDVEYRFAVVDEPEPNAFALPGGYVYVTRGLLALVNSEDELAGVIGHEIGHVAARHSVQQVSRAAPFAIITNLSAAVTGLASPLLGQVVGGVGGLASGLVLAPFNRDQEREADRVGQQMAAEAGWDPAALSVFLQTLEREEALRGGSAQRFSFLASHPSTPERVANTAAYAREVQRASQAPITPDRAAFLRRLDGLVVGARAADGVFDGQSFLHPDLDFTVRFPKNWKTQNSRRAVAAAAPDGSAVVMLESVADGDDPFAGARALQQASGAPVVQNTQAASVGSLKAARTHARAPSDSGEMDIEIAWIAHAGHIYQLTGITPIQRGAAFRAVFDEVMQSFRPLRRDERAHIYETRLRIVAARHGETLAGLVTRTKSSWDTEMVAVANGLPASDPLTKGQILKAAIAEPYAP